ncbi:hypothetical protein [Parasitella parasitica]|uniref:Uncharacterized protein n=1 Tax=Parasitella parasitica TaxID=35722 RepID=A0A0B7NIB1_9FUNG|nr:hypothetical protein [Parasitella parasitica]
MTIISTNTTTLVPKKPALLLQVDTACTSLRDTIQFNKRRHHSSGDDGQHTQSANCNVPPPLLFSPTSSVSSSGSASGHWSPDLNNAGKRSKVEDMIYFFENGYGYMDQHRRYSVDSHLNRCHNKKNYIRERWYEYQPTVGEWRKRIHRDLPPTIQLSESQSTPVQQSRPKMTPIMKASRSVWA